MLLSVCGVNSVCLNTAHTSCEENATKLQALIAYMLQGRPVGEGVRLLALPPPEVPPEDTGKIVIRDFVDLKFIILITC